METIYGNNRNFVIRVYYEYNDENFIFIVYL
jgi:hypothetical protein